MVVENSTGGSDGGNGGGGSGGGGGGSGGGGGGSNADDSVGIGGQLINFLSEPLGMGMAAGAALVAILTFYIF